MEKCGTGYPRARRAGLLTARGFVFWPLCLVCFLCAGFVFPQETEMILPRASSGLHLARLLKILKKPRGNAVLFGNIGTGKTTVARLALHAIGSDIVEASSIDDILPLFLEFLFGNHHVFKEEFLSSKN